MGPVQIMKLTEHFPIVKMSNLGHLMTVFTIKKNVEKRSLFAFFNQT